MHTWSLKLAQGSIILFGQRAPVVRFAIIFVGPPLRVIGIIIISETLKFPFVSIFPAVSARTRVTT